MTTFSITAIGTLGGATSGYGINNLGHVTSTSYTSGEPHAFYWNGNEMKDPGTFSTQAWGYGGNSVGYALSDKDEIVGRSSIVTAEYGGFYWDPTREYNNMGAVYLNMIDYAYSSVGGGTMPNRQGEVQSINSQGRFAGTIAETLLSSLIGLFIGTAPRLYCFQTRPSPETSVKPMESMTRISLSGM